MKSKSKFNIPYKAKNDDYEYILVKDYNGRCMTIGRYYKDELDAAMEYANYIIKKENKGKGLTVRIYKQLSFVRQDRKVK